MKQLTLLFLLGMVCFEGSSVTAESVSSFIAANTSISAELLAFYPMNQFTAEHDITGKQVDGPSAGFSYVNGPNGMANGAVHSTSITTWSNYATTNFDYPAADTDWTVSVWTQLRNSTASPPFAGSNFVVTFTASQIEFSINISGSVIQLFAVPFPATCDVTAGVYFTVTYQSVSLVSHPLTVYCNGLVLIGPIDVTLTLILWPSGIIKPQAAVQFGFFPMSAFDVSLACFAAYGTALTGPESMKALATCNALNSGLCNGCAEGTCQASFNGQMPLYTCNSSSGGGGSNNNGTSGGGGSSNNGGGGANGAGSNNGAGGVGGNIGIKVDNGNDNSNDNDIDV